ncbi:major allergen I polypeptide chain 1 precursor [Prionailurus iriomotensis]
MSDAALPPCPTVAATADCEICPAVKRDVDLFLTGTPDEYVEQVAQYNTESEVLENARILKNCVDAKMTEEDKENALSLLLTEYTQVLCVNGAITARSPKEATELITK